MERKPANIHFFTKILFVLLMSATFTTRVTSAQSPAVRQARQVRVEFAKAPFSAPSRNPVPYEAGYPADSDPRERGPFGGIVASRISILTVTWKDQAWLKTDKITENLLQELLTSSNTQTWDFHVWSYSDVAPALIATVQHLSGKTGVWVIWAKPNLTCAYQDDNGKWWWGIWDVQKESRPRTLLEAKQ